MLRFMTQGSAAPPGWYPDGQGRHRWWDGEQWTDAFQEESEAPNTQTPGPIDVKSVEGVATLDGSTLTFTFGRLAGAKRAASPVVIDILTAHEIQGIEPTAFKPGLLRVIVDPDEPDVGYGSDPHAFIFAAGRKLKAVKALLDAVGKVSPSGLSAPPKSVNASLMGEASSAFREAGSGLGEVAGELFDALAEMGKVARQEEGIFLESDFASEEDVDNDGPTFESADDPRSRIQRLHELHQDGLITQEEFDQRRSEIIAEL